MRHWTMGLDSDKTYKVFCINNYLLFFYQILFVLYHNSNHPSFIKIVHVLVSTSHKTEPSVCGYTINTKETVLW